MLFAIDNIHVPIKKEILFTKGGGAWHLHGVYLCTNTCTWGGKGDGETQRKSTWYLLAKVQNYLK